jgi:hypothetical protein
MSSNQQLALYGGGGGGGSGVITAYRDPRQQSSDDFEILANSELFDMFVTTACHLNTLQHCHRGKHRFQVLTTPFIRDSFQAALGCIPVFSTAPGVYANTEFSLDKWYFDLLPDEIKARQDPSMNDIQNASSTEHDVDWMSALKKLQSRYPGIVNALYTAIQSQVKITEKTRDSINYALNYVRAQEDGGGGGVRMGDHIRKGVSAPSSSGGGGRRLIG